MSWVWDVMTETSIVEKFLDMPLLNLSDVIALFPLSWKVAENANVEDFDNVFIPRQYAQTWGVTTSLQRDEVVMPPMSGPSWFKDMNLQIPENFERVTTVEALVNLVLDQGCFVEWRKEPSTPFQVVLLDDFRCVPRRKPNLSNDTSSITNCR